MDGRHFKLIDTTLHFWGTGRCTEFQKPLFGQTRVRTIKLTLLLNEATSRGVHVGFSIWRAIAQGRDVEGVEAAP